MVILCIVKNILRLGAWCIVAATVVM